MILGSNRTVLKTAFWPPVFPRIWSNQTENSNVLTCIRCQVTINMKTNLQQGMHKKIAVTDASNVAELLWFAKIISDFKIMIELPYSLPYGCREKPGEIVQVDLFLKSIANSRKAFCVVFHGIFCCFLKTVSLLVYYAFFKLVTLEIQ